MSEGLRGDVTLANTTNGVGSLYWFWPSLTNAPGWQPETPPQRKPWRDQEGRTARAPRRLP